MTQIERIRYYEALLDQVDRSNELLARVLDVFEKSTPLSAHLADYLQSEDWQQDFTDDEAGKLPAELKRGVLSEDGIFNVLEERRQLLAELLYTVARSLEG
ncbi:MAG: DUF4298 domain-containing protein [Oscillospiraceae bacterium]|nr:DUF4298 domain-containing protein [Oscillospiraceae bacterium]